LLSVAFSRRFHAVGAEEGAQLLGIELGLLERCEVPTALGFGNAYDVGRALKPCPGWRTMSPGKSEKPDGTSTRRASCAGGIAALARYMRIDEPIVPVSSRQ